MLDTLIQNPFVFMLVALSLIVSISIHEFAHAFAADRLGDSTPRSLGRLTLNPLSHLDPIGTIMLLMFGFGFGKPVPFNPYNLKYPKRDGALIAFAGPLSNFLLALFLSFIFRIVPVGGVIGAFLYLTISYNIMLGVFNLLPISPLDGFRVVYGILPPSLAIQWLEIERFGIFILLFLVFTDSFSSIVGPIVDLIIKTLI